MATETPEETIWSDEEIDIKYEKSIATALKQKNSQISPTHSEEMQQSIRLWNQRWADHHQLAEIKLQNQILENLIQTTLLFRQNKVMDDDYGEGVILDKKEVSHKPYLDTWTKDNTIAYEVVIQYLDGKTEETTLHISRYLE